MANKHVMYHSISFLPVYGSCLAHIFMRQVFIALCIIAIFKYAWLQLPAQRIYSLLFNVHLNKVMLVPGLIEPFSDLHYARVYY